MTKRIELRAKIKQNQDAELNLLAERRMPAEQLADLESASCEVCWDSGRTAFIARISSTGESIHIKFPLSGRFINLGVATKIHQELERLIENARNGIRG